MLVDLFPPTCCVLALTLAVLSARPAKRPLRLPCVCLLSNVERDAAGGMSRSDLSRGKLNAFNSTRIDLLRLALQSKLVRLAVVRQQANGVQW